MLHMKQNAPTDDSDRRTEKRKIGDLGEEIALKFLVKQGFSLIERNYLRKWGEIDLIVSKGGKIHFVEVKTVSRSLVSYETYKDHYRPEDNLHPWKLKRLSRTVQTYLMENRRFSCETDWQFDLITVYLDFSNRQSRVEYLGDIII